MKPELLLPGRTAREKRATAEAMRRGDETPRVKFFDLTNKSEARDLTRSLKVACGKRILVPWNAFAERTKQKAKRDGIYRDQYDLFSRDILELGKPKGFYDGKEEELAEELRRLDAPSKFLIVHFPWSNVFSKIPRQKEFKKITQSREKGIHSANAQDALVNYRIGIGGGGVGGWNGLSFVRAGAENVLVADGSTLKPHRGNRPPGSFISSIGENQAIYFAKNALDINPYGNFLAIPQHLGDPKVKENVYSLEDFVRRSDFIYDEMDDLITKAQLRFLAREMKTPLAQITDLGRNVAVQLDDPKFEEWPCYGRLTLEVYRKLLQADLEKPDTFVHYAREIFMGQENITPKFEETLKISKEKNYTHLPQSGVAASKAGSAAVSLFCDYVDGEITHSVDKLIT